MKEDLSKAIISGVYISLAGLGYLVIGGLPGAILFGAGLFGVIVTGSLLYTGRIFEERNYLFLGFILLGNIIGCAISGLLSRYSYPDIVSVASSVMEARVMDSWVGILWKSIGCGFLMTSAVQGMKTGNPWPLLLGIPLFILAGFYHSVADAFYFFVSLEPRYLVVWPVVVLGNLIGGKLLWIRK